MPPLVSPRLSTPHNPTIATIKTPSPNYFGFQSNDGSSFLTDTPHHSKSNWSPPSSAVRSTAAASPSVVPVDQNPEFDAFRRQSEGKAFNLGGLSSNFSTSGPAARSKHGRHPSRTETQRDGAQPVNGHAHNKSLDPSTADIGRSPKRVLSPGSMILPEEARRASPASFQSEPERRSVPNVEHARFALPLDTLQDGSAPAKARAETLPASNSMEAQIMVTPQHVVNLMESRTESVLLLDLRVQTQYAASHISGALNLCIPTTLLKRPSFNCQKLAEAFKDDEQRHRFEGWRSSSYIIVYDASSAQQKDATVCINTIKKFRSEGYTGTLYIIKGGFSDFSRRFSSYVERDGNSTPRPLSIGVDTEGPECAPVMGGCPMPSTDKPANPFFGNIRQNMDLIGGVGQIAVKHPSKATNSAEKEFPEWLQTASEEKDQGKKISNKFEQIERREKKRMEDALCGKVSFGTPRVQSPGSSVQIAGLEKGNKNRYNNIWPFEHTRVKLQGVPSHGCDYINASHVKASYSNKRYISTQAPIPATFNDFWNVVWQQDVRVIVMLSAEKEGAQVKAHNYWDKKQYGPLQLEFLSEKRASIEPSRIHRHRNQQRPQASKRNSTGPQLPLAQLDAREGNSSDIPNVIVRRFTLRHEKHPFEGIREITQLQYTNWPDFGAPAHPAHLLGLVEQCDAVVRSFSRTHSNEPEPPNKRPMLVHCSAGCGRTGTFCTVDSVIDMLKRQRISRRQREASPMDIDNAPRRSIDQSHSKDGGSFFPSQTLATADRSVDGSWVYRDDQDLVEKTVEDFRHQRLSMVQSLRQYVLCYESIMEWLVEQHGSANSRQDA